MLNSFTIRFAAAALGLAIATSTGHALQDTKAIGIAEIEQAIEQLPSGVATPNRYALLVGAGTFQDSRITELQACRNDAQGLFEVLTDPRTGMFPRENVQLLLDDQATEQAISDALIELGRIAGPDDLVLVFFSGHGAVDESDRAYWVTYDTVIDRLRTTALRSSDIEEYLEEIETKRLVTLIDACYAAATVDVSKSKSLIKLDQIYPEFDGEGRIAITASAGDQLSVVIPEGQPGHGYSAFAFHVIEGLSGAADAAGDSADGVVTADELWNYVKDRTQRTAKLANGEQQPRLLGELGSKFLLTIDSERLVQQSNQFQEWTTELIQMLSRRQISAAQYEEAQTLLSTSPSQLSEIRAERRQIYLELVTGKLKPSRLTALLNLAGTDKSRGIDRDSKPSDDTENDSRTPRTTPTPRTNNSEHEPFENRFGMRMVYIEPGTFFRTDPDASNRSGSFAPEHTVELTTGYWISQTEITQRQWNALMSKNPSSNVGDDLPVDSVTWEEAVEFCRRLSGRTNQTYRLPTEAEWEYACRATTQGAFHGPAEDVTWHDGNSNRRSRPAASKTPNEFGLYDMHGNIGEWVADVYKSGYGVTNGRVVDPLGPTSGNQRVVRGGNFMRPVSDCTSSARIGVKQDTRFRAFGFRIVMEQSPTERRR